MTTPEAPFGRMLTAMATAFTPEGTVDLAATARIAEHLIANGNDGVVVSGTTGEAPTTTTEEDGRILAAVKEAVAGRGTVVAGVGTNATAHSIELAKQAARLGADAILLVTPYYNKPSQVGVQAHFTAVAQASGLPTMLYDVPGRTGTTISEPVYEAMIGHELVVAVKDAVGDLPRAARLSDLGYAVYGGDDVNILGHLAHGACGLVSVVGHVAGRQLSTIINTFLAGDPATALASYRTLLPAFAAVMGVPNYGATTAKAALQLAGVLDNRRVRMPLAELSDDEAATLRTGLTAAGLL